MLWSDSTTRSYFRVSNHRVYLPQESSRFPFHLFKWISICISVMCPTVYWLAYLPIGSLREQSDLFILQPQNTKLAHFRNPFKAMKWQLFLSLYIYVSFFFPLHIAYDLTSLNWPLCYSAHIPCVAALKDLCLCGAYCLKCPSTYANLHQGEIPASYLFLELLQLMDQMCELSLLHFSIFLKQWYYPLSFQPQLCICKILSKHIP